VVATANPGLCRQAGTLFAALNAHRVFTSPGLTNNDAPLGGRVATVGAANAYLPLRKEPTGAGPEAPKEALGQELLQTFLFRGEENAPRLVFETVRTPDGCQLWDCIKFEI
jgi:hypothetical protein